MKIAALQLPTLPMSGAKLDYYFRICREKEVKLVLLCEYALNSFFKELETMPYSMIKEQSNHKIAVLKELCKTYDLCVVAPIVHVKGDKLFKSIAKFTPRSVHYFEQQFLINFKHWNEEKFFHNKQEVFVLPTFMLDGFRVGIVSGFELHFDTVFEQVMQKNIDLLLCPSSCTFDSLNRWQELLKMRAYLNNTYILRANRIGTYLEGEVAWRFYGHSNLINPFGEVELTLGDKEEVLLADIDKEEIAQARKMWGWKKALSKRGMV
ncbi:MAG: carbon-nitrogen hydrolase family protein [Sulfurospirillum sp.]|nr:carbon-nitrogen hydrolase family protein [Sulfurospirillum sp.]